MKDWSTLFLLTNLLLHLAVFRLFRDSVGKVLFILSAYFFSSLYSQQIYCQDSELISARLTLVYGSNIPFNFNTMEKFKNGLEIINGTVFGISLVDKNPVGSKLLTGFNLNFKSFNGQTNIKGDVYSLPLNSIRVKAENVPGFGTGTSEGYQDLAIGATLLFSYTNTTWVDLNWADYQLNISYLCGKSIAEGGNGSLLGEEPDFYNVEIEFELWPTITGSQPIDPIIRLE
jgi:hypothetical protein